MIPPEHARAAPTIDAQSVDFNAEKRCTSKVAGRICLLIENRTSRLRRVAVARNDNAVKSDGGFNRQKMSTFD